MKCMVVFAVALGVACAAVVNPSPPSRPALNATGDEGWVNMTAPEWLMADKNISEKFDMMREKGEGLKMKMFHNCVNEDNVEMVLEHMMGQLQEFAEMVEECSALGGFDGMDMVPESGSNDSTSTEKKGKKGKRGKNGKKGGKGSPEDEDEDEDDKKKRGKKGKKGKKGRKNREEDNEEEEEE